MPGSSLWLVPPQPSEFETAAQELISTSVPRLFPNVRTHRFIPHITLTSLIDASSTYKDQPQQWLDGLALFPKPVNENLSIRLDAIEPGVPFFKKLTLRASKDDWLVQLAAACRSSGVEKGDDSRAKAWAEAEYLPHLSLMYADVGLDEVANQYAAIESVCRAAFDLLAKNESLLCTGGSIVLVDTTERIDDWNVIAARNIPEVHWIWDLPAE